MRQLAKRVVLSNLFKHQKLDSQWEDHLKLRAPLSVGSSSKMSIISSSSSCSRLRSYTIPPPSIRDQKSIT